MRPDFWVHGVDSATARDRARGCFLAGALGDALGAAVEFFTLPQIQSVYGPAGIQALDRAYGFLGAITDDTQMTLFTAEGLIRAHVRFTLKGICHPPSVVAYAYQRWLHTQGEQAHPNTLELGKGWLLSQGELHHRRAPGATCLSALRDWTPGQEKACNDSKGCGTAMRSAPFGFFEEPMVLAGECSDITHGHIEARTASMAFAHMVHEVLGTYDLAQACRSGAASIDSSTRTFALLEKAYDLANGDVSPVQAIPQLGEGWVAEEALAIGAYCAIKADGDLLNGLRMAVNHSGDSDSTGSICGNLMGAAFGMKIVPEDWLEQLEVREVIDQVAVDMVDVQVSDAESFEERYPGA